MKTADAGEYEETPFFKAGADMVTVLGIADDGTVKGVLSAADKYGGEAVVAELIVDQGLPEAVLKERHANLE